MFAFTVTPDNGESYKVTAGTRDVLKWERTTKGASLQQLHDGLRITEMYRIAYIAVTRQGLYVGTLAEFEATCELDFEDDEEGEVDGLDPTQSAP